MNITNDKKSDNLDVVFDKFRKKQKKITIYIILSIFIAILVGIVFIFIIKNKVNVINESITKKQIEFDSLNKNIEKAKDSISKFKDTLLIAKTQALTLITEETKKPVSNTSIPKLTKANTKKLSGWAFYGISHSVGGWSERNFNNSSGSPSDIPKVDDIIIAKADINLREGVIEFDPSIGWTNKPAIGLIKYNQKFKVLQVESVLGNYIWVKVKPI